MLGRALRLGVTPTEKTAGKAKPQKADNARKGIKTICGPLEGKSEDAWLRKQTMLGRALRPNMTWDPTNGLRLPQKADNARKGIKTPQSQQ